MKPYLDKIVAHISQGLKLRGYVCDSKHLSVIQQVNRKKAALPEEAIFQCIGMLAEAVGPHLTKLLHNLLDPMFDCGLSEPLVQALLSISRHIPPLLRTIQGQFSCIGSSSY